MLLEVHMLQNFAPSNLNRDDTGSPKDCEFGGYRRARISSQSLKRAMRTAFKNQELVQARDLATRTKRVVDAIATRLESRGRPREQTELAATALINSLGLGLKEGLTQYLLFLSEHEIETATRVVDEYWDALLQAAASQQGRGKANAAVPAEAVRAVQEALNGRRAADLALFGRMIADKPEFNVEAASQVAHAISTNRVSVEFDFYTAVDDLKPSDTAGADMLGTVEFNSATFYRYANLDVDALMRSLVGDRQLAQRTVWAFLWAAITAIPTGKQNSMAAHNLPSFVMVTLRTDGAWNLANAFLEPAKPGRDADLMQASILRLEDYWKKLTNMYGVRGISHVEVATLEPGRLTELRERVVRPRGGDSQIEALIDGVMAAAFSPRGS